MKSEIRYIPNVLLALYIGDKRKDRPSNFANVTISDIVRYLDNDDLKSISILGDMIFDEDNTKEVCDIVRTLRAVLNTDISIKMYTNYNKDNLNRTDIVNELLSYVEYVT